MDMFFFHLPITFFFLVYPFGDILSRHVYLYVPIHFYVSTCLLVCLFVHFSLSSPPLLHKQQLTFHTGLYLFFLLLFLCVFPVLTVYS